MQPIVELVKEQTSESKQARQKEIPVEKGIKGCSSGLKLKTAEVVGDSQPNSIKRREESVQHTRYDNMKDPRVYVSLKGIILKKGIQTYSDNLPRTTPNVKNKDILKDYSSPENLGQQIREECVKQLSWEVKPTYVKEMLLKQGLKETWVKEQKDFEKPQESSIDFENIVNDINQFTANLETNPPSVEWHKLRSNLQQIHRYYINNLQGSYPQERSQFNDLDNHSNAEVDFNLDPVQLDIDNIMEHVECKINSLDFKAEEFNKKYSQTLLNRKKAYNDMMALQSMRKYIGQRLSQFEMEIRASRRQLLQTRCAE